MEDDGPGYWVARSRVIDPVAYRRYTDLVPGILEKYGGKVLSRGAPYEIVEGPSHFERFVVIEFASRRMARRCFDSPEYRDAATHRRSGAGEVELVLLSAGDGT